MITVFLTYKGEAGNAVAFVHEMESSGIADAIRNEPGNLSYKYYLPMDERMTDTVMLVDSWTDQAALDAHHESPMMEQLAALREKYDLHMTAEKYICEPISDDEKFLRR